MKLYDPCMPILKCCLMGLTFLCAAEAVAQVRGRALLLDGPSRVKPGNLVLCTINGMERRMEPLVTGAVMDAHFSPDGKQIVFGMDGMIRTMDLATRAISEICPYSGDPAQDIVFTWGANNRVYWSDPVNRGIMCVDLATKECKLAHKGGGNRATVSHDGTRSAGVMPPLCAFIGGKQFRYTGGCGGSISPSGRFLTSNLTQTHQLIGIYAFEEDGPAAHPLTVVVARRGQGINGFSFGRNDDWVCYTVEHPKTDSPTACLAYWPTDFHVEVAKQHVIKDYFDESALVPTDAVLDGIALCGEGPAEIPLTNEFVTVGATLPLRVVGRFRTSSGQCTAWLREGVTWEADCRKVALAATECKGAGESSGPITVTAVYKGQRASFMVIVRPALTGDGFKAEYFDNIAFTNRLLTRVEPYVNYEWQGADTPDPAINGHKPWAARWTGTIDVRQDGAYTFGYQYGEGNGGTITAPDGSKQPRIAAWVDDVLLTGLKGGGYPWTHPGMAAPIELKSGRHTIRVETTDASAHPVVVRVYWSGPEIKHTLLGGGYVHSGVPGVVQ